MRARLGTQIRIIRLHFLGRISKCTMIVLVIVIMSLSLDLDLRLSLRFPIVPTFVHVGMLIFARTFETESLAWCLDMRMRVREGVAMMMRPARCGSRRHRHSRVPFYTFRICWRVELRGCVGLLNLRMGLRLAGPRRVSTRARTGLLGPLE